LNGHAINPDTGRIAEILSECLAQGFGSIKGTNTIFFIPAVTAIPRGRKATYLRVVSAMRPEKVNPYRVCWTVGGDKFEYPFNVSTKTADLTTTKILINSVVSTPNAKFLTVDLKDFYLGTPMARYKYMHVPIWMLPDAIIDQYNLHPLFHNGYVYVKIRRGMYGLTQAGRIANDQLIVFLKPHGYKPCPLMHGLWRHVTRDIVFSSVVHNFGVRYTARADADHPINTLQQAYEISKNWTGAQYCGLSLHWDYINRTCDMSMSGYIQHALLRFTHAPPRVPEHSPHPWQRPNYSSMTQQFALLPDATSALDAADKTRTLEVLGALC
jgi:hypothetical protein